MRYAHVIETIVVDVSVWSREPTEAEHAFCLPAQLFLLSSDSAVGPGWVRAVGEDGETEWVEA
jgi:hypothetical protein